MDTRSLQPAFGGSLSGKAQPPRWTWLAAFLTVWTLGFATRSMPLLGLAFVAAICLLVRHAGAWALATNREQRAALLLVCGLTLWLPVAVWRDAAALAHFTVVLLSLTLAFVVTRDLETYRRCSAWLIWAALAGVGAYLARTGLEDFPLEDILPNSSSNGITSYLIVLQANHCLARFLTRRKPTLITPALTLVVCVVGYGRGSLLAATAVLLVNVVALLEWRRPLRSVALLCALAGLFTWTGMNHGEELAAFVETNTKIGAGLTDPHRELQIDEYLDRIDTTTLLTGADYRGTSIETAYNNNPHNAYIRAHHIFGLPYLLLMLGFPLLLTSWRLPLGTLLYCGSLIGIVLLRAFTEPILFPTLLDLFYFAACFALGRSTGSAVDGYRP
jgi:hypothetical protein